MRIALFGDIHSNYHALEAVLSDIERRGADRLICLGDITMKGPLPKECVDRVRDLGCPVVLGNTDQSYRPDFHPAKWAPRNKTQEAVLADFDRHVAALTEEDRRWLQSHPLLLTETWEGVQMEFFHAAPHHNYVLTMPWASDDELAALRAAPETRVSVFGHNHRPFIRTPHGLLVVNAGSVGLPFDGDPRPSYALLEVSGGQVTASLVRVAYDPEPAIQVAKAIGMPGWELFAYTLRTGNFAG